MLGCLGFSGQVRFFGFRVWVFWVLFRVLGFEGFRALGL